MALFPDWVLGLFDRKPRIEEVSGRQRGRATHIVILDGTASSLMPGCETNAGLTYKLLSEQGRRANLTLYYEAGIQWRDWTSTYDVMAGRGINRQIERAYGVLASRWRPGDEIILIGYSRGAYAVRSLAGVIGEIGLLEHTHATSRNVREAYRHYRADVHGEAARAFTDQFCHPDVQIEAVAVWDTVKALGLRIPVLWRWAEDAHQFHNHRLGAHVRNGFQALAINETREAYAPVMWKSQDGWTGHLEQVWFRGCHGDVGGQVHRNPAARALANIPLVWLLQRVERCGVAMPDNWEARFACNPAAPSAGNLRGWGWLFWSRRRRIVGADPSERLHETVPEDVVARFAPPDPVLSGP